MSLKLFYSSRKINKHDEEINNCFLTPQVVQAHDSTDSTVTCCGSHDFLTFVIASLQDSQSHGFLAKYHCEMKCFVVE